MCDVCGLRYATQRGKSQHEVKRHPETRNAGRIATFAKPPEPKSSNLKVWTQEEIDLLITLEESVPNSLTKNVDMKKYFINKTTKQISDKRRMLRLKTEKMREIEDRKLAIMEQKLIVNETITRPTPDMLGLIPRINIHESSSTNHLDNDHLQISLMC